MKECILKYKLDVLFLEMILLKYKYFFSNTVLLRKLFLSQCEKRNIDHDIYT